jgi:hypothetical protein
MESTAAAALLPPSRGMRETGGSLATKRVLHQQAA